MPSPEIRYSYKDVPTIREFSRSNAFIRGLLGPFRCVSADTEFLSPLGWRRIDQYKEGDLVAQWDKDSNQIEFVKPIEYIVTPCDELLQFEDSALTMRLTENHRIPHFDWKKAFIEKPASYVAKRLSTRTIPDLFDGPENDTLGLSDDLIRFAVMMQADGHFPSEGRKAQIVVRKERKKERIRWLLGRLGLEYKEVIYPSAHPTETTFNFVPPIKVKHFECEWWNASKRELAIVLEEYRYWDGLYEEEKYSSLYSNTCKECADFIQYAAHANGRKAVISKVVYKDYPHWKPVYNVGIRRKDSRKNSTHLGCETTTVTKIPTVDGKAYCFSVPSTYFLARCEDSIFITGNSGKSSGCVIELIRRGLAQEPSPIDGIRRTRWMVVRNTYGELRDTTIKTFHQWFPPRMFGDWVDYKHEYKINAFENTEIEVLFRALDRPDHMSKLLSLELTGAWVNEAREVPWAVIEALQGRVGQFPPKREGGPTWSGLILDTNPPDLDSDWYRFFEEEDHPEKFRKIFRQPSGLSDSAENIDNLPNGKEYYINLSTGKSTTWTNVYIHGNYDFVTEGRPVFEEYNDEIHCKECQTIEGLPIYVGLDFGLTPAAVYSQITPDGHWLIVDELNATGMGIDRFSDEMIMHQGANFPGRDFIYIGDPAGNQRSQTDERTCFDILHAKGIPIEPGMQTLKLRLESVRKPLRTLVQGTPQFVLHPRCRVLQRGFLGGYQWRRLQVGGTNRYTDYPDKNRYSHCFPAGTKVLTSKGDLNIEEVETGDFVYTPLGKNKVTNTMVRFSNQLLELQLSNGTKLTCTKDHPVFVNGDFVEAQYIKIGDTVQFRELSCREKLSILSKSLMEYLTTQVQATVTSCQLGIRGNKNTYIGSFGNTITDLFHQVMMFTTRTVYVGTTTSQTWKPSSTTYMPKGIVKNAMMSLSSNLTKSELLSSGSSHQKVRSGEGYISKRLGPKGLLSQKIVKNAVNSTPSKNGRLLNSISVVTNAAADIIRGRGITTTNVPALSARSPFGSLDQVQQKLVVQVVQVRPIASLNPEKVYDLTIEDAHCFYANGVLVHNCHDALQYVATRIFGTGLMGLDYNEEPEFDEYEVNPTRNKVTGY